MLFTFAFLDEKPLLRALVCGVAVIAFTWTIIRTGQDFPWSVFHSINMKIFREKKPDETLEWIARLTLLFFAVILFVVGVLAYIVWLRS